MRVYASVLFGSTPWRYDSRPFFVSEAVGTTYDPKIFGERIDSERRRLGLSQEKFGELIGVTQAQISNWITGRRSISLADAVQVSQALGVSLDWLVGLSDERNETLSATDQAAAELFRMIREMGLERVVERARGGTAPMVIGMAKDLIAHHPPSPLDEGGHGNPPTNEQLGNMVRVLRQVEEFDSRLKAAEKKIDGRGRPRNTVGQKKPKAQ